LVCSTTIGTRFMYVSTGSRINHPRVGGSDHPSANRN
jgi:hypothetical protein